MEGFVAILARGPCEDAAAAVAVAQTLAAKHSVFLQLVDAEAVYSHRHLESAWLHAERAQREGRMTAKTLEAEFLMYLAGDRQVSGALAKVGVRDGTPRIVVCAAGARAGTAVWGTLDKLHWSRDPAGVPENPAALSRLAITGASARPEELVLERVALVDLRK